MMFQTIFNFLICEGTFMTKSIYITKKQVARKLGVCESTVSRWAKLGIIPMPFLLGPNRVVWDEYELDMAIESRKKNRGFLGNMSTSM